MSEQSNFSVDAQWWRNYMHSTVQDSPLYTQFYTHLPHDQEVGALLALIEKNQPVPPLFFSAVNFVLQSDLQHPLAAFYPYFNPVPQPAPEVYPAFRDFCLSHQETLRQILPTARLQTNEVTRCANLLPAFETVFQREERKPLALIEIGASAGLNLNWGRYGYHYGQAFAGDASSPVQIECAIQGEHFPPLPATMPPIASCQGIDIAPLDIFNEDHVRWLRACIWPEEIYRYRLLDAAIAFARRNPPTIHAGDACVLLSDLLAAIPSEQTICLWHSYVLRQCSPEVRACIEQQIASYAKGRDLYRVSLEFVHHDRRYPPRLELFTYKNGDILQESLATCTVHGEQMEWLQPLP